ncbi:MAG: dipeptide epimerase [Myxococcota bacterium]|nr:dipeptide epimerase [Myxococcota bacterium]
MVKALTSLSAFPLNINLQSPFRIASGQLDRVTNIAVRVELSGAVVGWGEVPILPPVTRLNQADAMLRIDECRALMIGRVMKTLPGALNETAEILSDSPAVRAGIEQALMDAWARSKARPAWTYFGTTSRRVTTDITVPICSRNASAKLARQYGNAGFTRLKTKVGLDWSADVERLVAMQAASPGVGFIVDANEGFTEQDARRFLRAASAASLNIELFEQPVSRHDWQAMAAIRASTQVPIAADESCRSLRDVVALYEARACEVDKVQRAKTALAEVFKIIEFARRFNVRLMIGAMVESRVGLATAAHIAAGCPAFEYVDLDTAYLMESDPIVGGPTSHGPNYIFNDDEFGHGARLKTTAINGEV